MIRATRDFVEPRLRPVDDVLGVVYRVDLPVDAWLHGVRALRPLENLASVAFVMQRVATGWSLTGLDVDEGGRRLLELTRPQWSRANETAISPPENLCGAQSEAMKVYPLPSPWREIYAACGAADSWGVFARSPEGRIAAIAYALPKRGRTPRPARRFWSAVSIHLAAAARLRSALEKHTEAVLSPDGRLLHAEGVARDGRHRDALRHAARAIDRARRSRSDPLTAIESWSAMVSGRWSLLDQFESDGRRFVVARVNEPALAPRANLSPQERHVAALVKLGRSNKEIAYELGLRTTTVAGYLHRICQKLGVRRVDLIT